MGEQAVTGHCMKPHLCLIIHMVRLRECGALIIKVKSVTISTECLYQHQLEVTTGRLTEKWACEWHLFKCNAAQHLVGQTHVTALRILLTPKQIHNIIWCK